MASCAALASQLKILEHLLTTTSNLERRQEILDAIDDVKNQQISQECLVPNCDDLAAQTSGLENRLVTVQAELDDPDTACAANGLVPGSDACILYLKGLSGEVAGLQNEIAALQEQQQAQGC